MRIGLLGAVGVVVLMGALWAWSRLQPGPVPEREGIPLGAKVIKSDEEWQQVLTPEQFRVTRRKGTECACSGAYWNTKTPGVYHCVCCGQALFDAKTMFDSGTGWPSFWAPVTDHNVSLQADNTLFIRRTEVTCSRCGAHLGHVFTDGPAPTGLRYCMNSAALKLEPTASELDKEHGHSD